MNHKKIAILVDSGSDVPEKLVKKYNMYVAPMSIIYQERDFLDGIDIKAEDVYARIEEEIPSTSLPSGSIIQCLFDQIKADGYHKVMVVTISSGLSGTHNVMKMLANQQTDLKTFVLDTKNISIGSGFSAIQAAQYIKDGMGWETLTQVVTANIASTKVFFSLATLKYLQNGGRIGSIASILGSKLNIKPVISCNEEGIFYTASKTIGNNKSINKALELAVKYIGDRKNYNLGVLHAAAKDKADNIKDKLVAQLPNSNLLVEGQISPALGVHAGPGAVGIFVQRL